MFIASAAEAVMIKDVMVRLDGTAGDQTRLSAVTEIAERFDSNVIGLFINVLPLIIPPDDGGVAAIESARLIEQARVAGDEIEAKIRQELAQLHRPVELRRFESFSDVAGEIAAREARTADVFVAIRPDSAAEEPEQLVESVLFETGRHLVLVPGPRTDAPVFDHVMIAWNASREATRAVAEALPYLLKAEVVSIVIVDEEEPVEDRAKLGPDLLAHLLHHGIGAAIHHVPLHGKVGSTLIAESQQLKPDMIVMGGYGHSKLREWLLGGATYEMVHNSPVPLLIAH